MVQEELNVFIPDFWNNVPKAEIQEAEQLKLVSMERKRQGAVCPRSCDVSCDAWRQADARDQQHCEAKKEWTAANEAWDGRCDLCGLCRQPDDHGFGSKRHIQQKSLDSIHTP